MNRNFRDQSPVKLDWAKTNFFESLFKKPLRPLLNYLYLRMIASKKTARYISAAPFVVDSWLWGQKGNDYASKRRLVNRYIKLKNAKILIVGCGTGRDIVSWLPFKPKLIVGIDYFNYYSAWIQFASIFKKRLTKTRVDFEQGDLLQKLRFDDGKFDVIGSDAVFEHIRDLKIATKEMVRLLKPGGVIYASFGPLWHSWHGDHFSGWDDINLGFNHLTLNEEDYLAYLKSKPFSNFIEEDGRTWIDHQLFSYLRPREYIKILEEAGLTRLYISILIEPNGVRCLEDNPELKQFLLKDNSEFDLLAHGMTIIYKKPSDKN